MLPIYSNLNFPVVAVVVIGSCVRHIHVHCHIRHRLYPHMAHTLNMEHTLVRYFCGLFASSVLRDILKRWPLKIHIVKLFFFKKLTPFANGYSCFAFRTAPINLLYISLGMVPVVVFVRTRSLLIFIKLAQKLQLKIVMIKREYK
jgi:hypothetical protein